MSDLKPCPFCGSKRIGFQRHKQRRAIGYKAMCIDCGVSQTGVAYGDIAAAAEAWNRRAQPAQAVPASCGECGKKTSDGWALYCVACMEKAGLPGQASHDGLVWREIERGADYIKMEATFSGQPALITPETGNNATQGASAITSVPLQQILTDPENQPNQYGIEFLMHGPKFAFKVGTQQFTLDYEPTEPGEFEFMQAALIYAFSTFTPDVKTAQTVPVLTRDEVADLAMQSGAYDEQLLAFARAIEQAVRAKMGVAVPMPPEDWSVFNTGAEVASGLTWAEAWDYMTPSRIERGWTAVCVADKSNIGIVGKEGA